MFTVSNIVFAIYLRILLFIISKKKYINKLSNIYEIVLRAFHPIEKTFESTKNDAMSILRNLTEKRKNQPQLLHSFKETR